MTAKDAIEYLVDQRASGLAPEAFAELIDRLIWMQADNGTQLMATMNDWLEGDDHYRIKIALGLEEAFLFDSREVMAERFAALTQRWPDVAARCAEILEAWDRTVGSKTT